MVGCSVMRTKHPFTTLVRGQKSLVEALENRPWKTPEDLLAIKEEEAVSPVSSEKNGEALQ